MEDKRGPQRRYTGEFRERAINLVLEAIERQGGVKHGVITRISRQLDVGKESLRKWVEQAEVDGGRHAGTTSADKERIKELERENRELRRSNEILKSASAFFAAELDRQPKR
jgi:transposase